MRLRAATVLVLTALALLGLAALESDDRRRPGAAAAAAAARVPLLGVVGHPRPNRLVRLHPRTLRPTSREIRLRGQQWTSAWSPDRRHLALAVATSNGAEFGRSRIQIVDVERWRTTAVIDMTDHNEAAWLAWSTRSRVLAVAAGGHSVLAIDPFAGRIARATRFREMVVGDSVRSTPDGLAMLIGAPSGIGPVTLGLVSDDGALRRVPLEGIEAGIDTGDPAIARRLAPALAVDHADGRAYVVEAGGPSVIDVELATGTATRHEPGRPALQWLRDLVDAQAEAKAVEGPWRTAHVLGDGMLAVTGWDDRLGADGLPDPHPYGLRLIDTRDWSVETIDARIGHVVPVPGALLVADGGYGEASGVAALELDGTPRFRALAGRDASAIAIGGLVYATPYSGGRTQVIDLRSGRTVKIVPPGPPPLLIPPPAG
jgi:hypothetical protein